MPRKSTTKKLTHHKKIQKSRKKKVPECDGLPPSEAELLTRRMMNRFHDRWADRDEVYENFVIGYRQWRKFSSEAVKQLEGGRRRYVCEDNLSRIFEQGLLRHRPRVVESERKFEGLEKTAVVGVKAIRNEDNSEVDSGDGTDSEVPLAYGSGDSATSPEKM